MSASERDKIPLAALLEPLERAGLVLEKTGRVEGVMIGHLANDSRMAGPDGLFVAIRGAQADGHLFIDKAVYKGAVAVIGERGPAPGDVVYVRVSDARAALAEAAAVFYGRPAEALRMVGVTGTNGKTTTTFLIHHLLTALGEKTGLIGTVTWRVGNREIPATHTTPDALALNQLLREMVEAGCRACVMEVSSHALDQERVRGVRFAAGLFTNLTHDHLDFHGSFEAYLAAKKRLFDELPAAGTALYNADDPAGVRMVAGTAAAVRAYGLNAPADYRAEVVRNTLDGLVLRIDGAERAYRLVGLFNAYNVLAAYAAGRALGFGRDQVLNALAGAPPVPGRFEQLRFQNGVTAIVDYAHTPDALENVLQTIRQTKAPSAEVWCVFGCGGDRDPAKRRIMGAVAERYADYPVVTSDNPRTEAPEAIVEAVLSGFAQPERATIRVDRREAIRLAVRQARPGDVVLVAGKGHETYQMIGAEKRHFDDREEVRAAFRAIQTEPCEPTGEF